MEAQRGPKDFDSIRRLFLLETLHKKHMSLTLDNGHTHLEPKAGLSFSMLCTEDVDFFSMSPFSRNRGLLGSAIRGNPSFLFRTDFLCFFFSFSFSSHRHQYLAKIYSPDREFETKRLQNQKWQRQHIAYLVLPPDIPTRAM